MSEDPGRTKAVMARLGAWLCERRPRSVGFYFPIGSEPDPAEAVEVLVRSSPQTLLALPASLGRGRMVYRLWRPGEALQKDAEGIFAPPASKMELYPEIIVSPCLGFSEKNLKRLGYGGGYFDRYLSALTERPLVVGAAFEVQRVDEAIFEPHDVPLDAVVTERRLLVRSRE